MVMLYKWSLDYHNIIYDIIEIKKSRYKKLDIFILSIKSLSTILKTIISGDSINKRIALTKYLHTKFLYNLKNKVE